MTGGELRVTRTDGRVSSFPVGSTMELDAGGNLAVFGNGELVAAFAARGWTSAIYVRVPVS